MRKILAYLQSYLKAEFHLGIYSGLAILLALGMVARYTLGWNTYFTGQDDRLLKGFLFYCIPYFGAIALIAVFTKKWLFLKNYRFWLISGCILLVLILNQYALLYNQLLPYFEPLTHTFLQKIGFNLYTGLTYLLIPFVYYQFSRQKGVFYGLSLKNFDYKPYAFMLVLMLPLLMWASFRPDFLKVYPRYIPSFAEQYWQVSPYVTVGVYELSYILQFVLLELFFRGFMVMELEKYLEAKAILPMVCVYAFIHFGKPMPETLGSIFGGFILGILALRTRSIFGGVLIHIGIALAMELLAYWQMT